jgi:hypothetical protein
MRDRPPGSGKTRQRIPPRNWMHSYRRSGPPRPGAGAAQRQISEGSHRSRRSARTSSVCCQSRYAVCSGSTFSCCHHLSSSPRRAIWLGTSIPAFPIWPEGKDYAASALSAALGFLATMVSSERAAGSGNTRPCSQLRSVARGIRRALANSA